MILYIHGFRTTPQSHKADLLKNYFKDSIIIADFRISPSETIQDLEALLQKYPISGIIASSLGGFYASYLSERHNLKTILINPSTLPFETTRRYLGENTRDDGSTFIWEESDVDALRFYDIAVTRPENYLIFLQTGDEILDYTLAKKRYNGSAIVIEEGGNHRFDRFERYFDKVSAFLAI